MNRRRGRRNRLLTAALIWVGLTVGFSAVMYRAFTQDSLPSEDEFFTPLPPTVAPLSLVPTPASTTPAIWRFDVGVQVRETAPNVDESIMADYMAAARQQLNLNWVGFQLRWDLVESQRGSYNWGSWDVAFNSAQRYGLKVALTVYGTPAWARPAEARIGYTPPPQDEADFLRFLETLLTRYPDHIHALEVWPRTNVQRQWDAPAEEAAPRYVGLLSAVSQLRKRIAPALLLISGGLEPTGGDEEAIDDFIFMDTLISAGLLNTVDCVGVRHNGYNIPPDAPFEAVPPDDKARFRGPFENPHHSWSFYSTLDTLARKVAATGLNIPLCVTHFGWATAQDLAAVPAALPFAQDNTLREQSRWTQEAIRLMQDWGFVRLALLWNLNYGPELGFDPQDPSVAYSLIRPAYAIAPAWLSLAALDFRRGDFPPPSLE